MGLFTKKKQWHKVTAHYNVNGNIYRFEMSEWVDSKDKALTKYEFFNKYGVDVCAYDFEEGCFSYWRASYYDSIDDFMCQNKVEKLIEVNDEDVKKAIRNLESEIKKKFDEFPLDGTLYSRIGVPDYNECFNPVVKVKKKLIDSTTNDGSRYLILEVEELDGLSATTKYKFIPFIRFIKEYKPGHNMKVVASVETPQGFDPGVFESYFDEWYMY